MTNTAIAATKRVCRVVIVTAIPSEFAAVCDHLKDRQEVTNPQGTVYECGQFRPELGQEWEVLVVEAGPGNPSAAAEVAITSEESNSWDAHTVQHSDSRNRYLHRSAPHATECTAGGHAGAQP
jgi:hypothetical protein